MTGNRATHKCYSRHEDCCGKESEKSYYSTRKLITKHSQVPFESRAFRCACPRPNQRKPNHFAGILTGISTVADPRNVPRNKSRAVYSTRGILSFTSPTSCSFPRCNTLQHAATYCNKHLLRHNLLHISHEIFHFKSNTLLVR